MGRVEYSQLETGVAQASDINGVFSAIAAETVAVDGENVGEEGIDRSGIAAATTTVPAIDPVRLNSVTSQVLSTSWVPANVGGNVRSSSGTFTIDSGELVRVRGSIELLYDNTNPGIPAGGQVDVRIAFQINGGPVASITPQVGFSTTVDTGGRIPILTSIGPSGSWPTGIDWVQIEVSDQSGAGTTVQWARAQLQATKFRRV